MFGAWALSALTAVMLAATGASHLLHAQTVDTPAKADANAAKRADPAQAQGALDTAAKVLDAGKTDQVVQQINGLLAGSRLQGPAMARALYLRGAAYQKQGKPAQAIADLTSALWLKGGLSEADRTAATTLRMEAYRQAGLNDLAEADAKKIGRSGASASAAGAPPSGWQTESARRPEPEQKAAAVAPPTKSSGGVGGFFSNLFGGGGSSATSAGAAAPQADAPRSPPARQPSVGDAWSTSVDSRAAAAAKQSASVKQETAALPAKESVILKPATATPKAQGQYRLQVAAVRGRAEAQAVAARLKQDHAVALAGREPEVDETVIGNMGTFYRVRVGPFADASEPGALCTKLRGIGLDCLIMAE